jgi:hypothetical protein
MADGGLIMKFRFIGITAALTVLSACMMLLGGCTSEPEEPVTSEEWAYIYDTATTVLELKSNGQAIFEGVDYTYTLSDNILSLTDNFVNSKKTVISKSIAFDNEKLRHISRSFESSMNM